MTILVTGATGTVGAKVVATLRERGQGVRAGVRSPEKAAALSSLGAKLVRFDFGDAGSMTEAMAGVDRVFLLTPFVEEPLPLVQATVEAAKTAGVEFILRQSAAGAAPTSHFDLARHHGEGEQIVKESGIAWAVLRPTFFMDNLISFAGATIKSEGAFYGAAGDGKVAYISTRDIAAVAATILATPDDHHGKAYMLTGPQAHAEADVARLIGETIGKPVKYVNLSADGYRAALVSQGMPAWVVDAIIGLEAVKANGWAETVSPNVEQLTGRPGETLASFLATEKARLT